MKKILSYILAIMTAIGFSACNNGSNHNNGNAKAQNGNLLSL